MNGCFVCFVWIIRVWFDCVLKFAVTWFVVGCFVICLFLCGLSLVVGVRVILVVV